jgi:transposase-like protein
MKRYTPKFKAQMVQKMVGPSGVTATALAAETGVAQSSLSRWRSQASTVTDVREKKAKTNGSGDRRPEDWTPEEKFEAVLEANKLDDEALGRFLRSRGLHASHLEDWRVRAIEGFNRARQPKRAPADKKRIKELERELRRKEKALAEAAALLVLQKKVQAIWGDGDDSTERPSDE